RKRTRAATPVLTPQLKLTRPLEVSVAVGWARARRRVRRKLEVRRAAATPFHSRPRNGVPATAKARLRASVTRYASRSSPGGYERKRASVVSTMAPLTLKRGQYAALPAAARRRAPASAKPRRDVPARPLRAVHRGRDAVCRGQARPPRQP